MKMFNKYSKEECDKMSNEEVAMMAQKLYDDECKAQRLLKWIRHRKQKLASWFIYHPEALKQQVSVGCYSPVIRWTSEQRTRLFNEARSRRISEETLEASLRRSGQLIPHCHLLHNRGFGNQYIPAIKTKTGLIRKVRPGEKAECTAGGYVL